MSFIAIFSFLKMINLDLLNKNPLIKDEQMLANDLSLQKWDTQPIIKLQMNTK